MPTWVRIVILLVIYLIFALVFNMQMYFFEPKDKENKDKEINKRKILINNIILFIILIVFMELCINFIICPSYQSLSIVKICIRGMVYFGLIAFFTNYTPNIKKKINQGIQAAFAPLAVAFLFVFVISLSYSGDLYKDKKSFWNPVEIVETDYEEYESVGPTMDVYALDNDKEYHKSIGYNSDTGDYFYYYRGTNTGAIAETTISKNDIKSKNYLPEGEDTRVVIIKTTRCITRSEFKKSSKKYKTEETETKYRLYLNTKQIVPVEK